MTYELERALRRELDHLASLRIGGYPDRIRLTELVPRGMVLLAPFEKDGSVPGLDRRVGDDEPTEALVHPDDWEEITKPYRERAERIPSSFSEWIRVDQTMYPSKPIPTFEGDTGIRYWGIPVKDDTIKARMERER